MAELVDRVRRLHAERPALVWLAAMLVPFAVVAIGATVAPAVFVDHFLWEDIAGPLWSDAHQCANTVDCATTPPNAVRAKEGYTLTSEATYGAILAVSLYGIFFAIFKRYRVTADGAWVAALMPFILLGPFGRTLEDADVFIGADGLPGIFAYFFISPVIYIHIAVYTTAFLLLGILVERAREHVDWRVLTGIVAAIAGAMTAAYAAIGASYANGFGAFAPAWVFLVGAVLGVGHFWWRAKDGVAGVNATLFALGLPLAVPSIWLVGSWLMGDVWSAKAWSGAYQYEAGATILALAAGMVTVVVLIGRAFTRVPAVAKGAASFVGGLNLALVFGHMVDAFATWIALADPFRFGLPTYREKHPVSDMLLQIGAGTPFEGFGFPVAKLAMILLVIWLLDREFEKEEDGDRQLVGLIKMAIFVLGFAPGTRDLLRITMGV